MLDVPIILLVLIYQEERHSTCVELIEKLCRKQFRIIFFLSFISIIDYLISRIGA